MGSLILTIPLSRSPPPPSLPIQISSPWYNLLQSLFTTYDRLSLSIVYISTNTSNPSTLQLNIPLQVTPSTPNPVPLLPVINPLLNTLTSTPVSEIALQSLITINALPPITTLPAPRTNLSPYTEFVTLRRPAGTAEGDIGLLHVLLDQGAEVIVGSLSAEERARKPILGRSCAFIPQGEGEGGGEENGRVWACYVEWASPEGKAELMRLQNEKGISWDGILEEWGAERSFWKVREVRREEVERIGKESKGISGQVKKILRW